jgi:hypothetical protein
LFRNIRILNGSKIIMNYSFFVRCENIWVCMSRFNLQIDSRLSICQKHKIMVLNHDFKMEHIQRIFLKPQK